jgi:uncharacterized protein (UPF0333 family)
MAEFNIIKYFKMIKTRISLILLLVILLVCGNYYFFSKQIEENHRFLNEQAELFKLQQEKNRHLIDSIITSGNKMILETNKKVLKSQSAANRKLDEVLKK